MGGQQSPQSGARIDSDAIGNDTGVVQSPGVVDGSEGREPYTPTPDQVKSDFARTHAGYDRGLAAEFERMLAQVRREAAAGALVQFADLLDEHYPADVFPKPSEDDYFRLRTALARSNLTLDRFSADLMRRAAAQARREAAEMTGAEQ